MDLKRLNHLIALADERNFGRAALRVHLSQPAFSRSIQAAETELGLQLFDRGAEVACTPDAFRLCAKFIPNERPTAACLRRSMAQLSPDCRAVFEGKGGTKKRKKRRYRRG